MVFQERGFQSRQPCVTENVSLTNGNRNMIMFDDYGLVPASAHNLISRVLPIFLRVNREENGSCQRNNSKRMIRTVAPAGREGFHEVLDCIVNMQRSGKPPGVADDTKTSKVEREAIINNPEFMPQIAILHSGDLI